MNRHSFLKWFVKFKAFYVLGLLATGVWIGSKWLDNPPSRDWEPIAAALLLLGAIFGAEKYEQTTTSPDEEAAKLTPEVRRLMEFIRTFPRNEVKPADIQSLVRMIASTIARIHFDMDELQVPKGAIRVYPDNKKLDCDACHAKQVDVYPTGYCPRCKFESRSWMQL